MGKRKKIGNARSDAHPSHSQVDGPTNTIARSGIGQIALPSIIPLHVHEPFWSEAHKAWRIEAVLYEGQYFDQQWQHSVFFHEEVKAAEAYRDLRHCKTKEEWTERIASLRIRDVR